MYSTAGVGAWITVGAGEKYSTTGEAWITAGAGAVHSTGEAWITAGEEAIYSTTGEAWITAGAGAKGTPPQAKQIGSPLARVRGTPTTGSGDEITAGTGEMYSTEGAGGALLLRFT